MGVKRISCSTPADRGPRQQGLAMITTVMVMSLVAAICLSAMSSSQSELTAGGHSRSTMNSLYAAEAGIQFAQNRITTHNLNAFSFTLDDGTAVESRSRSDSSPQEIGRGGVGTPPEGYAINIGSGFINETYRLNVTASRRNLATTEIEVRIGTLGVNSGAQ